jgi:hypothetical protein
MLPLIDIEMRQASLSKGGMKDGVDKISTVHEVLLQISK